MKQMNLLLCTAFLLQIICCKTKQIYDKTSESQQIECILLDSILTNKTLNNIIGLNELKNSRPSIRFIDYKTKKFINCELLKFINEIPIEGFVTPELTYSLNTGQYRDIVILDYFKSKNNVLQIDLTVAYLNNQIEKEGIPHFVFRYKVNADNKINLLDVNIKQIRESRPRVDYSKIK